MLALRFYLSDLIETTADNWWQENHGITHYSRLFARIGAWRNAIGEPVALVTFNYDTLLDRSLDSQLAVGRKRAHWNDYVDRPDWRLYKLHGSTAWSRVLSTSGRASSSIDPASVIAKAESLNIPGAELRDAHWTSGDVAVPGIAVPTDRKQTFECPSHHVKRFHDVKVVDRLLIVGWRGAEPHALEILADVSPGYRLAIADVDDASIAAVGATLDQIAAKSPKPVGIARGFTGLLDGDVLEDWLALEAPGGWNE
jgi:hypothetical protein